MTVAASGNPVSAPHIGCLPAENDGLGGVHYEICSAILPMAAHDLRQELQVIIGARDLLARSIHGTADQAQLSLIEDAATRLAGTLDRLVDAVRLQQRSSRERHEPVPLRPLFAELSSEFAGPAELKGIKLRVRPVSAVVSSHPALLSGILRNLTRNAIDYTPCGGRVLVACRQRGSEAHIEVRDSGVGIPPGELTKIFEPFHRADATRADGLGLGLFIVKRAAELLEHRVDVRSTVGHGSCFVVAVKHLSAGLDDVGAEPGLYPMGGIF